MLIKDSPKVWSVWQVEIESLTLFIIARNKNTTYLTSRVFNLLVRQYGVVLDMEIMVRKCLFIAVIKLMWAGYFEMGYVYVDSERVLIFVLIRRLYVIIIASLIFLFIY